MLYLNEVCFPMGVEGKGHPGHRDKRMILLTTWIFLLESAIATNPSYKLEPPDSLQPPPYDVLNIHVPIALKPLEDFQRLRREHDAEMKL